MNTNHTTAGDTSVLTDISTLRVRARQNVEEGAATRIWRSS